MVIEASLDFKAVDLLNQLLELSLFEYMVVSVVDSRLLGLIFDCCLYKPSILLNIDLLGQSLLFTFFSLVVGVVEVPWDEDVLGGELPLLLVRPHVD